MKSEYRKNFYEKYMELIPKLSKFEGRRRFLSVFGASATFKKELKALCLDELLSSLGFIKRSESSEYSVTLNGLVKPYENGMITDDSFSGCYEGVNFRITEISNAMIRGKLDVYSGPWQGVIINIKFNKPIKTKIKITPKGESGAKIMIGAGLLFLLIGLVAREPAFIIFSLFWTGSLCLFLYLTSKKFQKVNLEDTVFSKKFYVETQDQIEARYILTTSFMERLNNLQTIYGSKNYHIDFDNNQVTFAFPTNKDLFEIGNLYTPLKNSKQINNFFNEITAITDMIDYFKLNERTGL